MIDLKIAHQNTFIDNYVDGISSPPYLNMTPFSWNSPKWAASPHMGMPDEWNFDWVSLPLDIEI